MIRLPHFTFVSRSAIQLPCMQRLISQNSIMMKKKHDSDESIKTKEAGKIDVGSLISNMENLPETEKPSLESIKSLMKNVNEKKNASARKNLLSKKMKEASKIKSKKGEEFLFKGIKKRAISEPILKINDNRSSPSPSIDKTEIIELEPSFNTETVSEQKNESLSIDLSNNEGESSAVTSNNSNADLYDGDLVNDEESFELKVTDGSVTSLQEPNTHVEQLKKNIKQKSDNRSVSKLMNALISEIDEELPNPEEKLTILMDAMNMNMKSQPQPFKDDKISKSLIKRQKGQRKYSQDIDLSNGESTKLFSNYNVNDVEPIERKMTLHQRNWLKELDNLLPESVPQNSFEVMMLDIDRQWNFPIDNEQNMGIEDQTSFEDHVFLDYVLDEFPQTEPIQKFMELVVTGLQQNPYLNVEDKKERIMWFKDYFAKFPDEELYF